jgi:Family of unknown function (DUF6951)
MASAEIESGICGFCTTVKTTMEGRKVRVEFETDCGYVEQLAEALTEVDPFREISYRGEGPVTLRLAAEHLVHPACPVPSGIIKAIEVEAGLALPKDASIKPQKG